MNNDDIDGQGLYLASMDYDQAWPCAVDGH